MLSREFTSGFVTLDQDPIGVSAAWGFIERLQQEVSRPGVDVNLPYGKSFPCPLSSAVRNGQAMSVALLLRAGACPNNMANGFLHPLSSAVSRMSHDGTDDYVLCAWLLLEAGAVRPGIERASWIVASRRGLSRCRLAQRALGRVAYLHKGYGKDVATMLERAVWATRRNAEWGKYK